MIKDKKKMWILILALVFVVCAGAFIALKLFARIGTGAGICASITNIVSAMAGSSAD